MDQSFDSFWRVAMAQIFLERNNMHFACKLNCAPKACQLWCPFGQLGCNREVVVLMYEKKRSTSSAWKHLGCVQLYFFSISVNFVFTKESEKMKQVRYRREPMSRWAELKGAEVQEDSSRSKWNLACALPHWEWFVPVYQCWMQGRSLSISYKVCNGINKIKISSKIAITQILHGHMHYLKQPLLQMHKLNTSPKKLRCKTPGVPDLL